MQQTFDTHWEGRDPWKGYEAEFERAYTNNPRYNNLLSQGLSRDSIDTLLSQPIPMKVFTWQGELDTVMSVIDSLKFARKFLQTGFMVMEPQSGFIKAWVGGINYKYYQYDHVNVNTKRQVGSTFKPFVYTVAIKEKGLSPCFKIPNELVTFEKTDPRWNLLKDWTPKNADGRYGGMLTLEQGLANSVNTVTAQLMHEMTPDAVIQLVRDMGISEGTNIEPVPAICLGTPDISLFEMVGAYGTFANKGRYNKPIFVRKIEDRNGKVIYRSVPETKVALNEDVNYVMLEMLRKASGPLSWKLKSYVGGKTGTTNNHTDGWFIGVSPDLVVGTWVGGEDTWVRFTYPALGQGSRLARPLYTGFMKLMEENEDSFEDFSSSSRFTKPKNLSITTECDEFEQPEEEEKQERSLDDFFEG
jgi:penicillin-binding protein 1A